LLSSHKEKEQRKDLELILLPPSPTGEGARD